MTYFFLKWSMYSINDDYLDNQYFGCTGSIFVAHCCMFHHGPHFVLSSLTAFFCQFPHQIRTSWCIQNCLSSHYIYSWLKKDRYKSIYVFYWYNDQYCSSVLYSDALASYTGIQYWLYNQYP